MLEQMRTEFRLENKINTQIRFINSYDHLLHTLSAPEKQCLRKIAVETVADIDIYKGLKLARERNSQLLAKRQSLVFNDSVIKDNFGAVRFLTENYLDSSYDSKGFRRRDELEDESDELNQSVAYNLGLGAARSTKGFSGGGLSLSDDGDDDDFSIAESEDGSLDSELEECIQKHEKWINEAREGTIRDCIWDERKDCECKCKFVCAETKICSISDYHDNNIPTSQFPTSQLHCE